MHKTDWFRDKKWGVFTHYLWLCQNNPERIHSRGRQTDWDACVNELDVELLARQLAEVNAHYLIFTMLQRRRFLCAPNDTFDAITGCRPGEACSQRDLVEDLYAALSKYGIDLLLYFTGDGPLDDEKAGPAMGYVSQKDKVSDRYVRNWAFVAREYSLRYGSKVKGWWVDGCYDFIGYDEGKLAVLADALRAGNPDAIVALNYGVGDRVAPSSGNDDFTCGEANEFVELPEGRFVGGAQWHLLSYLGLPPEGKPFEGWAAAGSRHSGEYMRDYVRKVSERGGVVSIDVCLYRDGSIDGGQLDVLKALRNI